MYTIMKRPEIAPGYFITKGLAGARVAGPFLTETEATGYAASQGMVLNDIRKEHEPAVEEPTLDPLVKLIRSLKVIRSEAMAETPEAKQELVDAALDVAATFIIGIYQQGQHLERISHALIAQTHLLAAVYSTADSPEETARRVAAAGAEMDANLAKMG